MYCELDLNFFVRLCIFDKVPVNVFIYPLCHLPYQQKKNTKNRTEYSNVEDCNLMIHLSQFLYFYHEFCVYHE